MSWSQRQASRASSRSGERRPAAIVSAVTSASRTRTHSCHGWSYAAGDSQVSSRVMTRMPTSSSSVSDRKTVSARYVAPGAELEGRRRHQVAGPQQLVGDVLGVQPRHGNGQFAPTGAVRASDPVQHPFLPSFRCVRVALTRVMGPRPEHG